MRQNTRIFSFGADSAHAKIVLDKGIQGDYTEYGKICAREAHTESFSILILPLFYSSEGGIRFSSFQEVYL
jgi:hypothetical protein